MRRLMSMGSLVFEDTCRNLQVYRPSHVKFDGIDNICINFRRLDSTMDYIFSTSHSKRGASNEEKIAILKHVFRLSQDKVS